MRNSRSTRTNKQKNKKENTDHQGINWSEIGVSREFYRTERKNKFQPYHNNYFFDKKLNGLKKKPSQKFSEFYELKEFYPKLDIVRKHFQLCKNVEAVSYHDLIYIDRSGISKFCTEKKVRKKVNIKYDICPTGISNYKDFIGISGMNGNFLILNMKSEENLDQDKFLIFKESLYGILNYLKIYCDNSVKVIIANNDKEIKIFDLENKDKLYLDIKRNEAINHVAFSPDLKMLASFGDQLNAEIFDPSTGKLITTLIGHEDYGFCVNWHPNGYLLATGNQDCTCRIWDVRNPNKNLKILPSEIGAVNDVKFSGDGKFLFCAEIIDFLQIYDIDSNFENYQEIDYFGDLTGIDLHQNEKLFLGVEILDYEGIFDFKRKNTKFRDLELNFI